MKYMLLIYTVEADAQKNWPDQQQVMGEYYAFGDMLEKGGHGNIGEALQPVATTTTVRVRDGKTQTSDGPYAETKEQLGGFYVVEAKDLDEAVQLASKIPDARFGTIEVRPLMVFEAPPSA